MANCTVSGTISSAATGDLVRYRYVTPQNLDSSTVIAGRAWSSTTTNAGVFSFVVKQDSRVQVMIDAAGIDIEFDVPPLATYNLAEELRPLPSL